MFVVLRQGSALRFLCASDARAQWRRKNMLADTRVLIQELAEQNIYNLGNTYLGLTAPQLYEEVIRRGEAMLAEGGAMVVRTGHHTGRSPNDKFIVRESSSEKAIWWGKVNRPMDEANFETLRRRLFAYLQKRDVFVQECYAGADPEHRVKLRVITDTAWQSLFVRDLFIPAPMDGERFEPDFTIVAAPGFQAVPKIDGTSSSTAIVIHFGQRQVLIAGSAYAGEIKKSVFTIMNYLLPLKGVLSMHCSANVGRAGDSALMFGLSGTGKTTLSADPHRALVGDDEHGWTDKGIFNFEGGCYAKVIRLSPEAEPQIYAAISRFGALLENVVVDPESRAMRLDDESITENTRGAYPLSFIPNAVTSGCAGHPRNVIMLTADAFGVLPPIAKLTPDQAMYHFLSGYTAKVAGTERGLGNEPEATFSTCFGAPFLPLQPTVYAKLLGEKIARYGAQCWLVNTGWQGGPYGVGERIRIAYTRRALQAALTGELDHIPMRKDPYFGFQVPSTCEGVPTELLIPIQTWRNPDVYDKQAQDLALKFRQNFAQFADSVSPEVRSAGPTA
jgi:phosphoenolpyruvate carboxykinase (ATP)